MDKESMAVLLGKLGATITRPTRIKGLRGSKYKRHQGEAEMARRRRHIASGQITEANGLMTRKDEL